MARTKKTARVKPGGKQPRVQSALQQKMWERRARFPEGASVLQMTALRRAREQRRAQRVLAAAAKGDSFLMSAALEVAGLAPGAPMAADSNDARLRALSLVCKTYGLHYRMELYALAAMGRAALVAITGDPRVTSSVEAACYADDCISSDEELDDGELDDRSRKLESASRAAAMCTRCAEQQLLESSLDLDG